jgi:hypothetical protein
VHAAAQELLRRDGNARATGAEKRDVQCETRDARIGPREDDIVHFLTNQLSVILGFAELLSENLEQGDPKRNGLDDILNAAQAAISRLPELSERLSRKTVQ